MDWIIEQTWQNVLFLHWKIPTELLRTQVPFDLDLFNGEAVISIVPFRMQRIRFPYSFAVPFVSSLWELNLRTYVRVNGVPGIYFLTLDTDSHLGQWIAKNIFHLPYRFAKMKAEVRGKNFSFKSDFENYRFKVTARFNDVEKKKTAFETWATDRYDLFLIHQNHIYRGSVKHAPWKLLEVEILELENKFSDSFGIPLSRDWSEISYCPELKVRFAPFERVSVHPINS
jgi:uncharacterized protein YqjF (DUF2071 family)